MWFWGMRGCSLDEVSACGDNVLGMVLGHVGKMVLGHVGTA